MGFFRRSLIGLFLLSVTVGILAAAGQTIYGALERVWAEDEPRRPARERRYSVTVLTVTPETLRPVITSFGEIQSRRTLELRSQASGRVVWLAENFEEGAEISAGAPLARIDDQDARGRRQTAAAELAEAEVDLRDARRSLDLAREDVATVRGQEALRARALARQEDLLTRGVGTEAAVETAALARQDAAQAVLSRRQAEAQAETRVEQAETALERRRIALAEAERRLAETEIRAAFSGRLGPVSVTLGTVVAANAQIGTLIDTNALDVAFLLSNGQYARLRQGGGSAIGAQVTVSLDVTGLDLAATGRIVRESAAVGTGESGRRLFAELGTAPGFRAGDFVTIGITEPPLTGVARLPAAAIDAAETVLAVVESGDGGQRLERLAAPLLRRQGDHVIVDASAISGRRVVSERTPFLGSGIAVTPIEAGPGGTPATGAEADLVALDPERRDRLIAFVQASERMPADARARVIAQLRQDRVPAGVVARLEARMGG